MNSFLSFWGEENKSVETASLIWRIWSCHAKFSCFVTTQTSVVYVIDVATTKQRSGASVVAIERRMHLTNLRSDSKKNKRDKENEDQRSHIMYGLVVRKTNY